MGIPTLDELSLLHDQICFAVADPKRVQILYALHERPQYVSELAEALEMPQPTVSRHLAVLRERALVTAERDGAAVVYRLADTHIIDALDLMRHVLRDALARRSNTLPIIPPS